MKLKILEMPLDQVFLSLPCGVDKPGPFQFERNFEISK